MKIERITKTVHALTLSSSLLWLILIILSPFLLRHEIFLSPFIYDFFSSLCHQLPSRCFFAAGLPMPVCTRCLGIYSGFLLGTLLYPVIKKWPDLSIPGFWIFAVFIFPVVTDTGGNLFGLWHTGDWIRFLTGVIWGMLLPFYFIPGISEAVRMAKKRN